MARRLRRPNFTVRELEMLVDSLTRRSELANNKIGGKYATLVDIRRGWEEVCEEVNSVIAFGDDERNVHDIREKWSDMKFRTKKKVLSLNSTIRNSDEISSLPSLTYLENRILHLMCDISVSNLIGAETALPQLTHICHSPSSSSFASPISDIEISANPCLLSTSSSSDISIGETFSLAGIKAENISASAEISTYMPSNVTSICMPSIDIPVNLPSPEATTNFTPSIKIPLEVPLTKMPVDLPSPKMPVDVPSPKMPVNVPTSRSSVDISPVKMHMDKPSIEVSPTQKTITGNHKIRSQHNCTNSIPEEFLKRLQSSQESLLKVQQDQLALDRQKFEAKQEERCKQAERAEQTRLFQEVLLKQLQQLTKAIENSNNKKNSNS